MESIMGISAVLIVIGLIPMIYILLGVGRIWTYTKRQSEEAVKQTTEAVRQTAILQRIAAKSE